MNDAPPFSAPVTAKELAACLRCRSERWVQAELRAGRISKLPISGRPYLIPAVEANRVLAVATVSKP